MSLAFKEMLETLQSDDALIDDIKQDVAANDGDWSEEIEREMRDLLKAMHQDSTGRITNRFVLAMLVTLAIQVEDLDDKLRKKA